MLEVDVLVAAIQKRPALYNREDQNYSNRTFISEQWKEVAEEVGVDEISARKKWTVIRDYFRRQYKLEMAFQSGANPNSTTNSLKKTKTKWYLYNKMTFLLPFMGEPSSTSNGNEDSGANRNDGDSSLDNSSNSFVCKQDADANESQVELLEYLEMPNPAKVSKMIDGFNQDPEDLQASASARASTSTSSATTNTGAAIATQSPQVIGGSNPKRKVPKYPQDRASLSSLDLQMVKAVKLWQEKLAEPKKEEDDDELFLRSLLKQLKKFDPISKMECRGDLHAVVLKYMKLSQSQS